MIQLFVENQELVLPEDFEFTQIDENPLITSNGEYTLDLTLSLLEPRNAKAFKHINRINKIGVDTRYDAMMIEDNKVKYGSVVIQKNTDTNITLQFLGGNSELNYNLTANNRKIWELDWDVEEEITYARALDSIDNPGYYYHFQIGKPPVITKRYFVCAPVKIGTEIANEFLLSNGVVNNSVSPAIITPSAIYDIKNIVMQPYLMYYIVNLPGLLGYTLGFNCLENDIRAKNMYILNSVRSLNYADALPNMTIYEFISELENFFNVIFKVDAAQKRVDIVSKKDFVESMTVKKMINVLDEYVVEHTSDEEANKLGWTKISYDLSKSGLLKYQFIDANVLEKFSVVEFDNLNSLLSYSYTNEVFNKMILYRDNETKRDYVYSNEPIDMIFHRKIDSTGVKLYHINKLAHHGTGETELKLKIVPGEIIKDELTVTIVGSGSGGSGSVTYKYNYQLAKSSMPNIEDITLQNVMDIIEADLYSTPRSNRIEVSLMMGRIKLLSLDSNMSLYTSTSYPFSYIDVYPEYGYEVKVPYNATEDQQRWNRWTSWVQLEFTPKAKTGLRINGTHGIVSDYHTQSNLDLSKLFYFTIPETPDLNTNYIYEYGNLLYLPIKFELVKKKEKGLVKGKFYRML